MKKSIADRLSNHIVNDNGCWIWQGSKNQDGYGLLCLYDAGRITTIGAHRLSYEHHVGPIPAGAVLMHDCDVRACINPDHLRPGSQSENIREMYEKGRHPTQWRYKELPPAMILETVPPMLDGDKLEIWLRQRW